MTKNQAKILNSAPLARFCMTRQTVEKWQTANWLSKSSRTRLSYLLKDLSEISSGGGGGGGVETEGGSQLFETAEKGGVIKNGPLKVGGSCKYVSVIM